MDLLAQQLQAALGTAYEITAPLGRGGMGVVYRATDRRLRREVAIKVLPSGLGYSEERRTRFVREARIAAGLSHPNIVSIHDVGEADELVWFVMALVEGESLAARVEREGSLPISTVRRVLQEVAQALGYAHARGVVHRDIKPDNILLEGGTGRAMVADFGIALGGTPGEDGLTQSGELVGTARYMSPEQALSEPVDGRADQYALGLVGWFMLTGQHALQESSLPAVIARHVRGDNVDLERLERRIPVTLRSALARCLAPRPADRYERVEQLAESLSELGTDLPETPAPVRSVLRETERTGLFLGLVAMGTGYVGYHNIPPFLFMWVGFSVLYPWVRAVEQAGRERVTWPIIRRAIYLERTRRVEELESRVSPWGLTSVALFAGGLLFFFLMGGWTTRAPSKDGPLLLDIALLLGGTAILTLASLAMGFRRRSLWAALKGGKGVLAADPREWRFPRWLDQVGSWLFARVVREGWRLRLARDTPTVIRGELTPGAFRDPLRRIRRAARTGGKGTTDVERLAEELASEGTTMLRHLGPVLARLARLQDGVLVSRTVGSPGSLESELDRVEAEAEGLRSRAVECHRLLEALAASLDRSDTTETIALLERARTMASEVRRLSEVT